MKKLEESKAALLKLAVRADTQAVSLGLERLLAGSDSSEGASPLASAAIDSSSTASSVVIPSFSSNPGAVPLALVVSPLRLLRVLISESRNASVLKSLHESFGELGAPAWITYVPQVCAAMSVPDPVVKQFVQDIIGKLVAGNPQVLLFPVVSQLLMMEAEGKDPTTMPLAPALHALSRTASRALQVTELVARQSQRASVLWEEMWIDELQAFSASYPTLLRRLQRELQRVETNEALLEDAKELSAREKYRALVQPWARRLRQLLARTVG